MRHGCNSALLLVSTVLVFAVGGCAPAAPDGLGEVSSINELVTAFEDNGGGCDWVLTDQISRALESGECSSSTVISTYDDAADRDYVVDLVVQATRYGPTHMLVGENWIINSPSAESMQDELGGEWVTRSSDPML